MGEPTYRRPFVPLPRRVPGAPVLRLRYKSMGQDHIVCREWDGANEGSIDVLVAKSWLLRQSTSARTGYTLAYTDPASRTSTKTADGSTESQVVVPSFVLNDEIWAISADTGVTVGGEAVEFLDLNCDARLWMKS
jgi:hypothetical protein